MEMIIRIESNWGRTVGIVLAEDVHILKRSSSSYNLYVMGLPLQYCCQDGCCDRGLQRDVAEVVQKAKGLGAKRVIIRTGQREYYMAEIEGLPVSDVTDHIGRINEVAEIRRR